MKSRIAAHLCVAGVLAWGAAAAAQGSSPSQAGASSPTQAGASAAADQVTVSGCVVSETDYRKARDEGRGGVAGTGVGAGNEFILTDASTGASRAAAGATGTSGTSAAAYELSGPGEGQLSRFVGKRVELTGKFKAGETSATGKPTGGPTAGAPPSGVDVGGKDLKLREFEVAAAREASGNCSAVK